MDSGLSFEKRVESLYIKLGKKNVRHNIHLRYDSARSQFDLSHGVYKKYFVECKFRSSGNVLFSDVATFVAKLYLHDIPYNRGVMVTNVSYDKRTKVFSKKIGLELIDGEKLVYMENKPLTLWQRLF